MSLGSIIGLIAGIYVANAYATPASVYLHEWFTLSTSTCYALSFFLIFVCVTLLAFFIARLIDRFLSIITLSWLNKLTGAVFGVLKYALILSVILNLADTLDKHLKVLPQQTKESSILYRPLLKLVPGALPYINFYIDGNNG